MTNFKGAMTDEALRKMQEIDIVLPFSVIEISPPDMVNHPAHYGGADNPHEHIKCMEATGLVFDAMLYTCTKYIWRAGKKGAQLEDLKKAAWYLNRRIQALEREAK